jgi:hypothetical protein
MADERWERLAEQQVGNMIETHEHAAKFNEP